MATNEKCICHITDRLTGESYRIKDGIARAAIESHEERLNAADQTISALQTSTTEATQKANIAYESAESSTTAAQIANEAADEAARVANEAKQSAAVAESVAGTAVAKAENASTAAVAAQTIAAEAKEIAESASYEGLSERIDAKLSRNDESGEKPRVYIVNKDGSQGMQTVCTQATAETIMMRDEKGRGKCADPAVETHTANKRYVDAAINERVTLSRLVDLYEVFGIGEGTFEAKSGEIPKTYNVVLNMDNLASVLKGGLYLIEIMSGDIATTAFSETCVFLWNYTTAGGSTIQCHFNTDHYRGWLQYVAGSATLQLALFAENTNLMSNLDVYLRRII